MNLHIIIPAHNEAANLILCVNSLRLIYPEAFITISTDGNTDATEEIALELEAENLKTFVVSSPLRMGKGLAIQTALMPNTLNAYYDADMAVNPYALQHMAKIAEYTKGLIIGKRISNKRTVSRKVTSTIYNNLVRLLFRTGISDHQCGCKMLSAEASNIALSCDATGFFFDTELIIRCKKAGLTITEYPVYWVENKKKSSVKVIRDGTQMLKQLVHLRFALRR